MSKDYGMFTEFGNVMVGEIVKGAKHKNLSWREVYDMLETISQIKGCEEATDTVVREIVYDTLGFSNSDNFYLDSDCHLEQVQ